ncbi:hypothetical protein AB5I41_09420 [Sphingomonas sp. MMS24-JH45]
MQFASNGASYRFQRGTVEERPVQWTANTGVPEAEVVVTGTTGDKPIARFAAEGPTGAVPADGPCHQGE